MKTTAFSQAAYRTLPHDFEKNHDSSVNTPWSLIDRDEVRAVYRDYLDNLMLAARSGFDGLAFTEHGQASYDMMSNPSLVGSALAYATDVEGLDVAICSIGRSLGKSREPVRVAEEYAMIDHISGGRLVAGFPVGLPYDACLNNGIPPIELRSRFDENLALVLRAWAAEEPFAFNGRFSQLPGVNIWPRPLQRPRPPVWLTGIGNPATMQIALEQDFGFNYISWFGTTVTGPRVFGRFWEAAEKLHVPKNPYRLGFVQPIGVADTDAKAERTYQRHVEYFFNKGIGAISLEKLSMPGNVSPIGLQALMRDSSDLGLGPKLRTATFAELIDAGAVILGSPRTVTERLTAIIRQFCIGNVHLMLQFGSMPREVARENIELVSKHVLPSLGSIWAGEPWEHHWWPERLGGRPLAHVAEPRTQAAGGAR
jgi:alkanesulfonate monooxygenase SsuD/methylene tetrahydromethanopterin reductase-like flavin-dependent oxidoreductase (luciferase family)